MSINRSCKVGDFIVNGRKIRALREGECLTAAELAEKVYVSQSMITYVENGIKKPSVELLKRLADFFGTTVDELLHE